VAARGPHGGATVREGYDGGRPREAIPLTDWKRLPQRELSTRGERR
jgi:hypothetical protein